jgi:hypothetical protein
LTESLSLAAFGVPMRDSFWLGANVRCWPKADTRGGLLGPKFGLPVVFRSLSVR